MRKFEHFDNIKEIMERLRLTNKFLNTKSDIDRKVCNKQRNYVSSLLRKENKISMVILSSVKRQIIEFFGKS